MTAAVVALLTVAVTAVTGLAAQESLLVQVELVGIDQRVLEAELTADSTLRLPARDVYDLLGLGTPPGPWLTVAELRALAPLTVAWEPRDLLVLIRDDREVLPASRRRHEALRRSAQRAPTQPTTISGPFASLSADDRGQQVLEAGYTWRGRVTVLASSCDCRAFTWAASVALGRGLNAWATPRAAQVTLSRGPVWLSLGTEGPEALLAVRGLAVFAAPQRDLWAITVRGPADVQVGRVNGRITARVAVGAFYHISPFGVSPIF